MRIIMIIIALAFLVAFWFEKDPDEKRFSLEMGSIDLVMAQTLENGEKLDKVLRKL